ncbi:MAG: hypothetical protein EBZ48_04565 [Proteobacteria bacterium]|nr:hypothetical protein [Pseudomonadota bacterium]
MGLDGIEGGGLTLTRRRSEGLSLLRVGETKAWVHIAVLDAAEGHVKLRIAAPQRSRVEVIRDWTKHGEGSFTEQLWDRDGIRCCMVEEGDIITFEGGVSVRLASLMGSRLQMTVKAPAAVDILRDELLI